MLEFWVNKNTISLPMDNQKYITDLHQDHQEWDKKLAFYEDELKIMSNRLAEVSAKNTDSDIKVKVEQFQNRFVIQKNEIDSLKHAINIGEDQITANLKQNPVAYTHRKLEDDTELRDKMQVFEPIFDSLKEDFTRFAAGNL
ncbi:hypothetical protein [Emticicia oligotrophica]|nr:hypothetical protein [Emticicia oligotrophica]